MGRDWAWRSLVLLEVQEHFGMAAAHIGVRFALRGAIAEMPPAIDDLFGRTAADAEFAVARR